MAAPVIDESSLASSLAALETIYRRNVAFVWRSLARLGVPECDLPDAAHDVFIVVHRRLGEFDARSRITTWLYGIALRVASDRRRKAATRYEVFGADVDPVREAEPFQPDDRRALLARALDAMTLEQRAVFTLFELEGMTGEEVALLLEIPVATAHSRLRLARETFRRVVHRARAEEQFDLVRLREKVT
jgi:RNA polymerase sigma-70 factor (ECF subfamily)